MYPATSLLNFTPKTIDALSGSEVMTGVSELLQMEVALPGDVLGE